MRENLNNLLSVYKNKPNYLGKGDVEVKNSDLKQLISNLYSPGPSFQFIFQFKTRNFIYAAPSCWDLFGLDPVGLNLETYSERIHPSDLSQIVEFEELAVYFLYAYIKKEEIVNYKVSYQLRIRNKDDNYKLFLHQAVPFAFEEDNRLSATLVNHSDISHITTTNNNKVSFINIAGGKSYFNVRRKEDLEKYPERKIGYKPRELEILGLISEGMDSKDIADYLNISVETVRTHRRNILARNDFNNISQAIAFYIREGLI